MREGLLCEALVDYKTRNSVCLVCCVRPRGRLWPSGRARSPVNRIPTPKSGHFSGCPLNAPLPQGISAWGSCGQTSLRSRFWDLKVTVLIPTTSRIWPGSRSQLLDDWVEKKQPFLSRQSQRRCPWAQCPIPTGPWIQRHHSVCVLYRIYCTCLIDIQYVHMGGEKISASKGLCWLNSSSATCIQDIPAEQFI